MQPFYDDTLVDSWKQPSRRFAFRRVESATNGPGRAATHASCGCDAGPSSRLWGAARYQPALPRARTRCNGPERATKRQNGGRLRPASPFRVGKRRRDSEGTFYCPLMSEAKRFYLSLLPGFTWSVYGCAQVQLRGRVHCSLRVRL